jgi:hypothetical protein
MSQLFALVRDGGREIYKILGTSVLCIDFSYFKPIDEYPS